MMPPSIAVTGATGRLGGRVARLLAERGIAQRLAVRSPERAPTLPGAVAVRCAYDRPDEVTTALEGADTVLMVSGSETPDRVEQHRTFIDAAAAAGVHRLVYVSFVGASPDATFTLARDHFATEEHLRASGLAAVVLRDNFYLDFLPELVEADGVIRGPAGTGRVAAVAQDDIAEAAVAILAAPEDHDGATYSLTGPEALTLSEAAGVIARRTGRPVTFHDQTVDEAYASRAGQAPDWQLDAWVSTYTAIAAGELDGVTDDIPRLTGHRARSLDDLLAASGGP
ncbi:SDR family oxidoreductase [Actinomycetospora lutea]|uniref:SDR family oxidoreductase n=1 Tax=Actinomycetospora lutea TaxID=663604 RepID=UPI002365168F|nr:SDR family oxidoreductase [Actinomycetospora lutea]MDD7937726.1 SDR family oxidoreductase [Actinomycetospora lutea]